jgi:hypothetical protein
MSEDTNVSTFFEAERSLELEKQLEQQLDSATLKELEGVPISDICGRSVLLERLKKRDRLVYTFDAQKRVVSVLAIRGDLV